MNKNKSKQPEITKQGDTTANSQAEMDKQLENDADKVLTHFPGEITIGQRREALRRLFIKRLGWAVYDKQFAERHPVAEHSEANAEADSWLERAIGETVVRAYALGLLHSKDGAEAEVSTSNVIQIDTGAANTVPALNWEGKPGDRRPCDDQIEYLHQELRECLPDWCEEPPPLAAIRGRIAQIMAAPDRS